MLNAHDKTSILYVLIMLWLLIEEKDALKGRTEIDNLPLKLVLTTHFKTIFRNKVSVK